jgi:hypothetical protein
MRSRASDRKCAAGFRSDLYQLGVIRVGWIHHPRSRHVRFVPKADKRTEVALSPLCAKTGLMHRSKEHLYSITLSASTMRVGSTVSRRGVDHQLELASPLGRNRAKM